MNDNDKDKTTPSPNTDTGERPRPAHQRRSRQRTSSANAISEPADVFDAMDALREAREPPVGAYLKDAAEILSRIATLLASDQKVRLGFICAGRPVRSQPDKTASARDWDEDFVGDPAQIERAIKSQSATILGWYLRDLGSFLELLALAFVPPEGSRGYRLRLKREGRGRRRDEVAEMLKDDALVMKLRFATRSVGKQEAAIEDLKKNRGASRASIFRKKRRRSRKSDKS